MTRQPKGEGIRAANFETHKAYVKAALETKRDCDELVDLLVDELRKQGPNRTVELLQAVIGGSRKADALWQWAKIALLTEAKIPREKLDELEGIQLAVAAFLAKKRSGTQREGE
jgi:hypothetical protein